MTIGKRALAFQLESLERRLLRAADAGHSSLAINFPALDELPRQAGDYVYGVAQFTDSSAASPAHYRASIDWGDGTTSGAGINDNRNLDRGDPDNPDAPFDIDGAHDYAKTGGYTLTLTITRTDDATGATEFVSASDDIVVTESGSERMMARAGLGDYPDTLMLNVLGDPISRSKTIDGTLAFFEPTLPAGQYHATVDWGDWQTSQGEITVTADGQLAVSGKHTYENAGSYDVEIRVTGSDHSFGSNDLYFVEGADPLAPDWVTEPIQIPTSTNFTARSGFDDIDPSADLDAYTVLIDWGDGTTSPGQFSNDYGWNSYFGVTGDHAYAEAGHYIITTTVTRAGATIALTTSANAYALGDLHSVTYPALFIPDPDSILVLAAIDPTIGVNTAVTHGQPPPTPLEVPGIADPLFKDHDDSDADVLA